MSQSGQTAQTSSFATAWAQLKAWAAAEFNAAEGAVENFVSKEIPVIEADVVSAIETFGQDLMGDAVNLMKSGLSPHETISTVADNLIMTAEGQGKTVANNLAVTVAGQVVAAASTQAGAMAPPAAAQ
jgi:hypothetical protein